MLSGEIKKVPGEVVGAQRRVLNTFRIPDSLPRGKGLPS